MVPWRTRRGRWSRVLLDSPSWCLPRPLGWGQSRRRHSWPWTLRRPRRSPNSRKCRQEARRRPTLSSVPPKSCLPATLFRTRLHLSLLLLPDRLPCSELGCTCPCCCSRIGCGEAKEEEERAQPRRGEKAARDAAANFEQHPGDGLSVLAPQ